MAKDSQIKFTYKDNKLIIKDGDKTKVFIIDDERYSQIFRYVLKAIDQLDGDDPDPGVVTLSFTEWPVAGGEETDEWFGLKAATGATVLSGINILLEEKSGDETKYIWIDKSWDSEASAFILHVSYVEKPEEIYDDPTIISEIDSSEYTILPETIGADDATCTFSFTYKGVTITKEDANIGRTK